jgi:hypothetical protein
MFHPNEPFFENFTGYLFNYELSTELVLEWYDNCGWIVKDVKGSGCGLF